MRDPRAASDKRLRGKAAAGACREEGWVPQTDSPRLTGSCRYGFAVLSPTPGFYEVRTQDRLLPSLPVPSRPPSFPHPLRILSLSLSHSLTLSLPPTCHSHYKTNPTGGFSTVTLLSFSLLLASFTGATTSITITTATCISPVRRNSSRVMDIYESTKVVFARIQSLEPDHVSKIIGYLLLQDHGDREMIRLAFGPDSAIRSLISRAKAELCLAPPSSSALLHPMHPQQQHFQFSDAPFQFSPYCPEAVSRFLVPHCDSLYPPPRQEFFTQSIQQQDGPLPPPPQAQLLGLDDPYTVRAGGEYMGMRLTGRGSSPPAMIDVPAKQCNYFAKGFCRHGSGCRFLHGARQPEGLPLSPTSEMAAADDEDHPIPSSTLERLENELLELLRAKRTPVSIASLPQLYFDRFGRTLQADGYLTESQRHGKAGYSLTKLLARLKNTIRVIDRPHGQHAVVPAEDAPRFTMYRSQQHPNGTVSASGSRQIYLTFPAESAFSEEDVSDYFKTYGLVQDVRIPCQQRRMFGFVTFVHAETVKMILAKGNPHYVCGARVLVKPYREKGKLGDRKYVDKMEPQLYSPHYVGHENELHAGAFLELTEAHDQAVELERRRLFEFQLLSKALNHQKLQNRCMKANHPSEDDTKLSKGGFPYSFTVISAILPLKHFLLSTVQALLTGYGLVLADLYCFPSAEPFGYLLEVLNTENTHDEKTKNESNNFNDQDSQAYDLPDSPFASPISASSISMASTVVAPEAEAAMNKA
ncbi:hypothetical protein ACLOJK_008367 [Asimina triloba]